MLPSKMMLWSRLRRVARALRHTPDRLLHGTRRRRSTVRLGNEQPLNVLFVCYGNICRSPYAAASFERLIAADSVLVLSAGFVGPGRPVPENGLRVALRRKLDLASHRSQLLTRELIQSSDLIVVMDEAQRRAIIQRFGHRNGLVVLGDLDPQRIDTRAVRDPFNQPEDVFDAVYARIDRCLTTLVQSLPEFDGGQVGSEAGVGRGARRRAERPTR